MKIVLDTNVVVSGLLFGGQPLEILEAVLENEIEAYTSEILITELLGTLESKFKLPLVRLTEVERSIKENFKVVKPTTEVHESRDADDDAVLEAALAASANYLISGDNDLLALKSFRTIPIITPGDFLRRFKTNK